MEVMEMFFLAAGILCSAISLWAVKAVKRMETASVSRASGTDRPKRISGEHAAEDKVLSPIRKIWRKEPDKLGVRGIKE